MHLHVLSRGLCGLRVSMLHGLLLHQCCSGHVSPGCFYQQTAVFGQLAYGSITALSAWNIWHTAVSCSVVVADASQVVSLSFFGYGNLACLYPFFADACTCAGVLSCDQ